TGQISRFGGDAFGPLERRRRPCVLSAEDGKAESDDQDSGTGQYEQDQADKHECSSDGRHGDPFRAAANEADDLRWPRSHRPTVRGTTVRPAVTGPGRRDFVVVPRRPG